MTWSQLLDCILFEMFKNPSVANMPAKVWLYEDVMYRSGEHEICSLDACFPEDAVSDDNRLSMNLLEDDGMLPL